MLSELERFSVLLFPFAAEIIILIIIIIITRPKPAFGRLGLGGSLGVKTLGEGKISKNVTELHHYIYHHHKANSKVINAPS